MNAAAKIEPDRRGSGDRHEAGISDWRKEPSENGLCSMPRQRRRRDEPSLFIGNESCGIRRRACYRPRLLPGLCSPGQRRRDVQGLYDARC